MQVYLTALGCRLNEAELETWAREFRSRGHALCTQPEAADLVVVNTCAVTHEAVRKSRRLIRRCHRTNPLAKLIVSGCSASLQPDAMAAIEGVDRVVLNQDKHRLVEITLSELIPTAMPMLATQAEENTLFTRGRSRAFVKIQDGCRYRCSFCIVTTARGEERSRSIPAIIDEINHLVQQGIKEAVLTGVHVGGYADPQGCNLQGLIQTILSDTDLPRLRLASVEPWDLPDSFFSLFDHPRLMPHMHLPLQSGCDTVLRRMTRRCKANEFERLVDQAKTQVADFNVSTDIIVGFPGETDKEWAQGLAFVEKIGFSHIHIFNYSARPGTKAAGLSDHVPAELKKTRCNQLRELALQVRNTVLEQQLNRHFPVLWEREARDPAAATKTVFGYTPNYLRVRLDNTSNIHKNQIERVQIRAVDDSGEGLVAHHEDSGLNGET